MTYHYTAFGLTIKSDVLFKELFVTPCPVHDEHDITIQLGAVNPHGLNKSPPPKGVYYQVTSSELWLHVPDVARFLVSKGHQITIEPLTKIDDGSIQLFVLGSCMGALLMQRNLFILHGNAIQINDEHCVSFVGDSGAGKSTLSGAFFKRGYSILADDICAVSNEGWVMPSFPRIKLCADAAQKLQIDTQLLNIIIPRTAKFSVPLGKQFHLVASKLTKVYVLGAHHHQNITLTPLLGVDKLNAMQHHLYRKQYLNNPKRLYAGLKQCMHIGAQIDCARITRPREGFKLDELLDVIESDLHERAFKTNYFLSTCKEAP
tara:strand:- start:1589 stop:2542 length:954 start_codon:yes stop_codon:yes gene_type:complete